MPSLAGADWECTKCRAKNVSFATFCTSCGASADIAKRFAASPAAPAPAGSAKGLIVFLFLVALVLGTGLLYSLGTLDPWLPASWRFAELLSGR